MEISEDELQAKIKAAIDEATAGLAKKNAELLNEVKEARKGKAINPAEVEKLQEKIDKLESDLTTSQKALKDGQKTFEKLTGDLKTEQGFVSKLLLDNGLTDSLVKAGVAKQFLPAVKSMLSGQAQIKIDGENRSVVIGDKSLDDFITQWSASDEGKHFIAAPANSGGGSSGGSGSGTGGKTVSRQQWDGMSHVERATFAKAGGQVTD